MIKPIAENSSSVILSKTTLCSIVRDEKINPAGGIIDFVRSTLPFVERAVIVDTGSIDGTRELLTRLQSDYPQLEVYDYVFDNHAHARNYALQFVKTKRTLVLDADERLNVDDFVKLQQTVDASKGNYFTVECTNIYFDHTERGGCHNPRLFETANVFYKTDFSLRKYGGEYPFLADRFLLFFKRDVPLSMGQLHIDPTGKKIITTGVHIKHFKTTNEAMQKKYVDFYKEGSINADFPQPAALPSFSEWKTFNPQKKGYCTEF